LCIYTFSEYWLFICVLYIKICVYTQFLRYVFLHRIVYIHNFLCTIHNLKCIVHNSHIFVIPTLHFVRCKIAWWTCCVRRASGKKYRLLHIIVSWFYILAATISCMYFLRNNNCLFVLKQLSGGDLTYQRTGTCRRLCHFDPEYSLDSLAEYCPTILKKNSLLGRKCKRVIRISMYKYFWTPFLGFVYFKTWKYTQKYEKLSNMDCEKYTPCVGTSPYGYIGKFPSAE